MAVSAGLSSSIKAFIKSSAAGKEGDIVNNKCMKMIAESTKLNKAVPQNDLDILFSGVMGKVGGKAKGGLTIEQFVINFIPELATKKPKAGSAEKIKADIEKASPELHGATKAVKAGAVDRLTDTSKYTGSHKERFDESGKGKGKAGRAEVVDNTGYVGDYKGEGSYDKKVGK